MASSKKAEEEEGKIPVFTVLKNNTILKNIFIVNKPPESSLSPATTSHEDVLLVGRHPDCDLMLTHPSISRFHLQIRSTPSSKSLYVVDLSSVHGTWVSGRKVEPGLSVEMKEGDTLRIGVSSRVYRLHWIPISRAYDLENPFLSQLDAVPEEVAEEPEEEEEEEEEKRKQGLQSLKSSCPVGMEETQLVDSILECISPLFLDDNLAANAENEFPAAPPMPEETLGVLSNPFGAETSSDEENKLCDSLNELLSVEKEIPFAPPMAEKITSFCCKEEMESQSRDETFGIPSSYVVNKRCDSTNHVQSAPYVESEFESDYTWTEYLSDCICLPQQFYTPPDTITSPSPSGIHDSFEEHCYSLLIDTDPASFGEESAAEAMLPTETQPECTVRDNGSVTVNQVIPDTSCQQIKVAVQSLFDEDYQNITKENEKENLQNLQTDREILGSYVKAMAKSSGDGNIWSRRGKPSSAPQIRTNKSVFESRPIVDTEVAVSRKKDIANKAISKNLLSVLNGEGDDDEVFTPDKEDFSPNTLQLRCLKNKGKLEEVEHSKYSRSHNSKDIFSSNAYPDEIISHTSCKENQKDLFSALDGQNEDEFFTPDKENFSPNTLRLQRLKKKGKFSVNTCLDENMSPSSNKENQSPKVFQGQKSSRKPFGSLVLAQRSQNSKSKFSANIYPDVGISPTSKKENPTPKAEKEHKPQRKPFGCHSESAKELDIMALNNRAERVPFQLLMDAGGKSISGTSGPVSSEKSINISNCGDKDINPSDIIWERKRNWDMVVDTATLTNKESRKALQLLKGLRGTRLIIPRLVVRELDSMKLQYSIFRRTSEASLALEWIEECMVKTSWWIHVQSSVEEEMLTAPTPPASPHTQFSEETCTFPFEIGSSQPSSHNYSVEIASPTVEDHILDFALLYRRRHDDGQLVVLSEDVTLKIKCMAEGLLCEPVQEFRQSIVNPFSERFMWTNSSPRGQTWSYQDDVVLREKYCRLPLRKSSKGVASGLKLILLHNSNSASQFSVWALRDPIPLSSVQPAEQFLFSVSTVHFAEF